MHLCAYEFSHLLELSVTDARVDAVVVGAALRAHLSAATGGSLSVLHAALEAAREGDGTTTAQSKTQNRPGNTQKAQKSRRRSHQAAGDALVAGNGDEKTPENTTKRKRASTKRGKGEAESAALPPRRSIRKAAAR